LREKTNKRLLGKGRRGRGLPRKGERQKNAETRARGGGNIDHCRGGGKKKFHKKEEHAIASAKEKDPEGHRLKKILYCDGNKICGKSMN